MACIYLFFTHSGASLPHRGPPGDLFVYLDIEEIPEIQRDGINLCSTISISYLDAILGTVTKVHLLLNCVQISMCFHRLTVLNCPVFILTNEHV